MAVEWQNCSGKNLILKWQCAQQNHGSCMVKWIAVKKLATV